MLDKKKEQTRYMQTVSNPMQMQMQIYGMSGTSGIQPMDTMGMSGLLGFCVLAFVSQNRPSQ